MRFQDCDSVIFQEFDYCSILILSIHISIPPALIVATLDQPQTVPLQSLDMLFHPFDFKGNVVKTWTVSDQLIIPGTWLAQGLDQFQADLPKVKERQSCLG
jgi:hypothetical protein